MGFFARIKEFIMQKLDNRKLEKTFGIRIASSMDMPELIAQWQSAYQGSPSWVGPGDNQCSQSLGVASTIAVDLAIKAVSEIAVDAGSDDTDQFIRDEILPELRQQVEYSIAMGAVVVRPYYDASTNHISLSWYTADRFIPVDWSGRRCLSGIFVDTIEEHSQGVTTYFTKLELQKWTYGRDGRLGSVDITVKAFKSSTPADISNEISLQSVPAWADIEPSAHVDNLTGPLFVYMGTPFTNNKAFNSKEGVSIYKDGMPQLEEIDRTFNALKWEREYTEGKVFVDSDMMEFEHSEDGDLRIKLNGKDRRIYKVMNANGSVGKFMETFSPAIRQGDYTAMLKTHLSLLCTACHLDSGAYVYDESTGAVTATEIRTKNQKTYQAICDLQEHMITPMLTSLLACVRTWQQLYRLPAIPDEVELSIAYGDSILIDTETDRLNAQRETQMGLRSKLNYLIEYRGLSEDDALRELERINQEAPSTFDFFGGGGNS